MLLVVVIGSLVVLARRPTVWLTVSCTALGCLALQMLVFRLFQWVYKPIERVSRLGTLRLVSVLLNVLFAMIRHALELESRSRVKCEAEAEASDPARDETNLTAVRFVEFLANRTRKLIPQTRQQLFPLLIAFWFLLALLVIAFFGGVYFSSGALEFGVPSFAISPNDLWISILGSFGVFTGTSIGDSFRATTLGLVLYAVEVVDALFLVGLFLALVIRLVPYDAGERFTDLEAALDEFDEEVAVMLEISQEEIEGRLLQEEEEKEAGAAEQ